MHLKDVIIDEVPDPGTKGVMDHDFNIINMSNYHIPARKGDTIGEYLAKVLDSVKDSYFRDSKRFEELLFYIKKVIWVNFDSQDKGQYRHYMYLEEHDQQLSNIRGKQPRKDQERLNEVVKEFILTCEEIIDGRIY